MSQKLARCGEETRNGISNDNAADAGGFCFDRFLDACFTGGKTKMSRQRVALYARVSTVSNQSPEMQLVELREYAARRDWDVAGEYVDHGVSGAKESRPSLNRLMVDAKQRRFDVVAVWNIDRFGRSLRHLVNSLAELENFGVSFVSLRDSIDLSSPSGVLMFQLIAAMSQFERSLIQERVKAGIRNARNKGRKLGRPRLEVDYGRIARLRENGASLRAISDQLGISVGTIHRVLRCSKKPIAPASSSTLANL